MSEPGSQRAFNDAISVGADTSCLDSCSLLESMAKLASLREEREVIPRSVLPSELKIFAFA